MPGDAVAVDPNGKIVMAAISRPSTRSRTATRGSDRMVAGHGFQHGTGANAAVRGERPADTSGGHGVISHSQCLRQPPCAHSCDEKSNLAFVEFNPASYEVSELDGFATITVERSATRMWRSTSPSRTNGTALAGVIMGDQWRAHVRGGKTPRRSTSDPRRLDG